MRRRTWHWSMSLISPFIFLKFLVSLRLISLRRAPNWNRRQWPIQQSYYFWDDSEHFNWWHFGPGRANDHALQEGPGDLQGKQCDDVVQITRSIDLAQGLSMSEFLKLQLKSVVEIKQAPTDFFPPLSITLPEETVFTPVTLPMAEATQSVTAISSYSSPSKGNRSGERMRKTKRSSTPSSMEEKKKKSKKWSLPPPCFWLYSHRTRFTFCFPADFVRVRPPLFVMIRNFNYFKLLNLI